MLVAESYLSALVRAPCRASPLLFGRDAALA